VRWTGLALAGIGFSHFVKPDAFEAITKPAFPQNTRQHLYIDGAVEAALGLSLISPRTRKLAVAGLVAYGAYLGANVIRNA
jgi:uncharacterized membrane protein